MPKINPLLALKLRAEARELLFHCAAYATIGDAIDPLVKDACDAGLIERYGAATVWKIIETAFRNHFETTE